MEEDAEEEIRICDLCELNKQVFWQKVQTSVLRRGNAIIAELSVMLSLFKYLIDFEETALFWPNVFTTI